MKKELVPWVALVLSLVASAAGNGETVPPEKAGQQAAPASNEGPPIPLGIGGCGGVYLLAEPGELTVDVEKRDRHRSGRGTELRAILAGPDRKVLQDVSIPPDGLTARGKVGPPRRVRLSTQVPRKGVYVLNITASQDRYGETIIWGFRTNCPRWLIETSRGHKDERHQEPIVLLRPDQPGDVCFLPQREAFRMEVADLPPGADALAVYDHRNTLVQTLRVEKGKAAGSFPEDIHRGAGPWRLHLPVQQATININGVTRWERDDLFQNLSLWTTNPASWFPFLENRWLLTPYSRMVFGKAETPGEAAFQVHNNSDRPKSVKLEIEFPKDAWPARVSSEIVRLGPKEGKEVLVRFTIPEEGQSRVCHLRATPVEDAGFSTYSTLTVRAGAAPASRPLTMPLVLKPYQHENEQAGYLPDYPMENQLYFDLENHPWAWKGRGLQTLRGEKWATVELASAVKSGTPGLEPSSLGMASPKIAFDRDGDVYLLARAGRRAALLHSRDGGKSFAAYRIPGRENRPQDFEMELFSGHNVPDGPPPILCYTHTASDPKRIWRRINDLELILPKKENGRISFGDPILISKQCIGIAMHSGAPSEVVSRGSRVHVVWGEATDPETKVPGVPTYVATYDRTTKVLGKPALVGHGAPANDVHNTPSITMDSQGYLHVLAGTHGRPFPYARSLKPNDAHSGWTHPVPAGENLSQTYIGLVCGPDDTLHLVYRLWQSGKEPFPASHYATLAYQRKRPGQPWEAPRVLIIPPFSEYSVFYHRLTIDRAGRLFLSYDYWSTYWFYRTDHSGSRRALLMSPDGGETWKLVQGDDLQRRTSHAAGPNHPGK